MLAAQECFLDQRLALRAVFDSTTLPSTSSSLSRGENCISECLFSSVFRPAARTIVITGSQCFPQSLLRLGATSTHDTPSPAPPQ
eukprot:g40735.t1